MAELFTPVPGVDELFDAQLRNPKDAALRTWCNVMDMFPWLPEPRAGQQVIDLGCGSGRVSIGMTKLWNPHARYWTVDGDADVIGRQQWCVAQRGAGKGFYTRVDVMIEFCNANDVHHRPVLINKDLQWDELPPPADVLFSMYSVGNHYPLTLYERLYPQILKDRATVCFTHNPATGEIPDYFQVLDRKPDSYKVLADIHTPGEFVAATFRKASCPTP